MKVLVVLYFLVMKWDLNSINLDDTNNVEDDPDTIIIIIRLLA